MHNTTPSTPLHYTLSPSFPLLSPLPKLFVSISKLFSWPLLGRFAATATYTYITEVSARIIALAPDRVLAAAAIRLRFPPALSANHNSSGSAASITIYTDSLNSLVTADQLMPSPHPQTSLRLRSPLAIIVMAIQPLAALWLI